MCSYKNTCLPTCSFKAGFITIQFSGKPKYYNKDCFCSSLDMRHVFLPNFFRLLHRIILHVPFLFIVFYPALVSFRSFGFKGLFSNSSELVERFCSSSSPFSFLSFSSLVFFLFSIHLTIYPGFEVNFQGIAIFRLFQNSLL